MRRRVVVTGIGCVTPVGNSVSAMWRSLQECASGIGPITHFDAAGFPTRFAAEVKHYDLGQYIPNPERFEFAGRNVHFAIGAAIASVSGEVDRVFHPGVAGREAAIAEASSEAIERAVSAGAARESVEVVEIEEVPLAYLTDPAVRIRVKAGGPLAWG